MSGTRTDSAPTRTRQIWSADNLEMLGSIPAGDATLVYLDPPFNSGRSYEALLGVSDAGHRRRNAFEDTWRWDDDAEAAFAALPELTSARVASFIRSLVDALGRCHLSAYLVMLAPRLEACRRVLGAEGSLYLHCDPAASHYLKSVLDMLMGSENFRNEIVWKRTHAHSSSRRFGPVHDVLLFYSRSSEYTWTQLHSPYSDEYIEKYFRNDDERGRYQLITCTAPGARPGTRAHYRWRGVWPPPNRHWAWTEDRMTELEAEGRLVCSSNGVPRLKRYVDDGDGVRLQDMWTDIHPLGAHSGERTGYETQKPLALLRRIIEASSRPGDLVVDPFAGAGTTSVAAEQLGRGWVVADKSLLASSLTLSRLRSSGCSDSVVLRGFPDRSQVALAMRSDDPTTFAVWGTAMLGTLLDRSDTNTELACGSARREDGESVADVISWVPLTDRPEAGRLTPLRHAVDRNFLLTATKPFAGLAKALRAACGVDVEPVPLDACVHKKALAVGWAVGVG